MFVSVKAFEAHETPILFPLAVILHGFSLHGHIPLVSYHCAHRCLVGAGQHCTSASKHRKAVWGLSCSPFYPGTAGDNSSSSFLSDRLWPRWRRLFHGFLSYRASLAFVFTPSCLTDRCCCPNDVTSLQLGTHERRLMSFLPAFWFQP